MVQDHGYFLDPGPTGPVVERSVMNGRAEIEKKHQDVRGDDFCHRFRDRFWNLP